MGSVKYRFSIALIFALFAATAVAQEADTSSAEPAPVMEESAPIETADTSSDVSDFRPIIGITGGMFTYFGDISTGQRANSPLTSNLAMSIKASFPLKRSFYVSFGALYGSISANERSIEKNRNFKTQITGFGVDVSYNFNHFLSEKRVLDPYLSVGFDALLFNSKTDLYDAEGREYHYWADGTIRDREETPENLNSGVEIVRDYEYETDHRNSNVSGAGYFEKYTFAVPVGGGVNMRLTHRLHAQLGVEYLFVFTDLLDGVSSAGEGVYKGNSQNDGLLYTHLGLSFDMSKRSGSIDDPSDGISDADLAAMTTGDSDFDGVQDLMDECPETPAGVEVDEVGCPFDEDNDGVPDYKDQELGSDSNAVVDSNGIALSDEQLAQIYLRFLDSNGVFSYYEDTIYTNELPSRTQRKWASQYSVQVDSDSLTDQQAQDLLDEDIKTVKDGDKDALLVGTFLTIEEALDKDKELRSKGIETRAIVEETATGKVVNADIKGVFVGPDAEQMFESREGTVFRIQVGAFKGKPDPKYYEGLEIIGVKNDDGFTRYYAGNYGSYDEAKAAQSELQGKGYGDCLIKAFDDGSGKSGIGTTIPVSSLDNTTGSNNTPPPSNTPSSTGLDKSKVSFKIQLGSYEQAIPMEDFNKFVKLGDVKTEKGLDGNTRYFVGNFKTYSEAEAFKAKLESDGASSDVFIAGDYDGKTIPSEEAMEILK